MRALLVRALDNDVAMAVPACVIAQVWRSGAGAQVPLARLLSDPAVEVVALDGALARHVDALCGASGHYDVIDASVVLWVRPDTNSPPGGIPDIT